FISDWIPLRAITIMPGLPGDHAKAAVDLIWAGKVPTGALLGEVFALEDVGEAFDLMEHKISGRDAIRVSLRPVGTRPAVQPRTTSGLAAPGTRSELCGQAGWALSVPWTGRS